MKNILRRFTSPQQKNSYFVTLEGIEGSGKSTQITNISDFFSTRGYTVTLLREPGGTKFGENLRNAILSSETKITAISEAYLFAASRAQLLQEKILPALSKPNNIVICDRYLDSSIAYQGFASGLGMESILNIHLPTPLNILPDLTIYLKISLETSLNRQALRNNKKDYFESKDMSFHKKLIEGYDAAAELFQNRVATINGESSIDDIFALITPYLKRVVGE